MQAVETVVLLTKCSLESYGLMSCVQLVASLLQHMIHVLTSHWIWNQTKGLLGR